MTCVLIQTHAVKNLSGVSSRCFPTSLVSREDLARELNVLVSSQYYRVFCKDL